MLVPMIHDAQSAAAKEERRRRELQRLREEEDRRRRNHTYKRTDLESTKSPTPVQPFPMVQK